MGGWSIAWTNLAVLAGAAAIFLPYVLHLLTRRTPRTMVFPTVQFLRRAHASRSALFRLRDVILLLVRTAFIVLLLLAFLKPVLRARAMEETGDRPQAAVIVADASLSMRYDAVGITPFIRGQHAIDRLLDRLGGEAVMNVVYAGATPRTSLETPSASVPPLKRDLESAAPTLERADVDAAIEEAVRQLETYPTHARSIYFVSDFQRTNWAAARFSAIPEDITLVFVPVGEPAAANVAITDVTLRPRAPVVSETLEVVCSITNFGPADTEVPVAFELKRIPGTAESGEVPAADRMERPLALPASGSASVNFRLRALDIGRFEGTVSLPDDSLPEDNRRYFTLEVHDQIDVLLVSDAVEEPRSGAHFLWRALDPFAAAKARGGARPETVLRARAVRARDLDMAAAPQVLVVDGAGALPERAARDIAAYVTDGGALVYFLSDLLDKANLEAIASAAGTSFSSPIRLEGMEERGQDDGTPATWAEANFDEPMLRRFKESRDLRDLHFYRYFATKREQGRGQVLARYDDGNVAIGRATLGAGSILLCNFSAARSAGDIAARPAFVPLIYEMVKGMRPREGAASVAVVGYPAPGAVPHQGPPAGLQFFAPNGTAVSASVDRRGDRLAIVFAATAAPGHYRITEGSHHIGSVAVNVDSRESDLLTLNERELAELSSAANRRVAGVANASSAALDALLAGIPIWPYLLVAALAVLGIEQALLAVLKR